VPAEIAIRLERYKSAGINYSTIICESLKNHFTGVDQGKIPLILADEVHEKAVKLLTEHNQEALNEANRIRHRDHQKLKG